MKKFIALLLALLMTVSCVGCGSTNSEGTPAVSGDKPVTDGKANDTLTVAITDNVATLDPQNYTRTSELTVINQIYDPLISTDLDGNIVYMLAESYTANEDGSSVDFVLREGVKFHSGDVLTAEDVAYTLERGVNSAAVSELNEFSTITVVDDTHFTWEFPDVEDGEGFNDLYTYIMDMGIVNKSFCEQYITDPLDDLKLNVDGTDAYTLKEVTGNNDVTLVKFDDYYGTPANIGTVKMKYISGSTETAFEAGNLDFAQIGATNFDTITAYSNVEGYKQILNNFAVIMCNCSEGSPIADINVRQAIAYCMNKDDITSIASNDAGVCAYNLATPMVEYYDDVCEHFDTDVDKANDLMKTAGYSDSNRLAIRLVCITIYPEWVSACEVIKEQLEQSYFDVSIEETSDTSRYFATDFDLAICAFTIGSIYQMYSAMFEEGAGLNLACINDAALQDSFKAITDEASAQACMKATTESLAYIPLYYTAQFFVFDSDLTAGQYNAERALILYKDFAW